MERIAQSRSYAKEAKRDEGIAEGRTEATDGWKEMVEVGDRWGEWSTRPRSNTCELISCEQVLSRYNINELRSICSTACTAPVHLANRSPLYPRGFAIVSSRFATRSDHPAFYEPRQSANNRMEPLAYCRLRFVYDSSSWREFRNSFDSYFSNY